MVPALDEKPSHFKYENEKKPMKIQDQFQTCDRVLVVGGGIGGIRTALDLAEAQKHVVLIDKANPKISVIYR